jgi:hypothetical protein
MPLRDHFRPPLTPFHSWDELHGYWPAIMCQQLFHRLPPGYLAAPAIHLGGSFEVDVAAMHPGRTPPPVSGRATTLTTPRPTLTAEAEFLAADEYEVRVYDARKSRRLVAAVKLVSPSNKDRPDTRRDFVKKCAGLLADGVSVAAVDVVTERTANLYAELLAELRVIDPSSATPPTYAAALRTRAGERRRPLDTWYHSLAVGGRLPELPLWLAEDSHVMLDLEASYEETCRYLHIT